MIDYTVMANESARRLGPQNTKEIMNTLRENQQKDFVQRVLSPAGYPVMKNADGSSSSHRMSSAEVSGKFIAFPTLFHDRARGVLYEAQDPVREAINRGQYIIFPTAEKAEQFAENGYKVGMNADGVKIPNANALLPYLPKH